MGILCWEPSRPSFLSGSPSFGWQESGQVTRLERNHHFLGGDGGHTGRGGLPLTSDFPLIKMWQTSLVVPDPGRSHRPHSN